MRRLARFLPFLLFGFILLCCYFLLTSFTAPVLTQELTYQDHPPLKDGTHLRTVTRTTTAYRKQIRLWEAQTSVTFSYDGRRILVTDARHTMRAYAPGWHVRFDDLTSREDEGHLQVADTIELWYGVSLFSRPYPFRSTGVTHQFVLSPNGSAQ